ncbi:ribonuclease HI [Clostridiales bacterium BAD-6]|jgi:ribonuclease HI|uniref:ribonuclease H n=1 Tax=Sinanaerobacter chloroacetimidivorans TaxID=2818044 RepID=A0A8J8B0Z7_9FIRM|nr:RNase H family protein [Sinanaerobacter chloroacetimidivorans]MBR0597699.1 ribonuclease HI [Sinanaerobacter chloroacetimidivorans]
MKSMNIYTDGACSGNQNETNIGGWGAILEYGEHQKELFGGERNTTNNRMEMEALLNALQALTKENLSIRVFSDSSYLMNCFREKWYENWYRNNWKTSKKTDVENRDLWEALFAVINKHQIDFYRVKGHVNLNSKNTNIDALYQKFIEWNGPKFTKDDFLYITKMNHRADELANQGIDSVKNGES